MDRVSSLSESNISTLCLGYTKFRYGIIQIGTISLQAQNRNSQLDIYMKSLSNRYQSRLIIKISIQDLYIGKSYIYIYISFVFLSPFSLFLVIYLPTIYICIHIYRHRSKQQRKQEVKSILQFTEKLETNRSDLIKAGLTTIIKIFYFFFIKIKLTLIIIGLI